MSTLNKGRYTIQGSWINGPNGNWCFAYDEKTKQQVFVKEFFKYKYPSEDVPDSPNSRKKREKCDKFFKRSVAINEKVNEICGASGSVVIAQDFFRDGLNIYKVNRKIDFKNWAVSEVCKHLTVEQIDQLMLMIVGSVQTLHLANIVHCDLKPDNIFIVEDEGGLQAMLTDFDDSFFMDAPPPGQDVVCSPEYMSPELGVHVVRECDEPLIPIAAQSDIFSLGMIFHQYLTGEMPGFNQTRGQLWSALMHGEKAILSDKLDPAHRALIGRMLQLNPLDRPNGKDVAWEIQRIRHRQKKQYMITLLNNKKPVVGKEIKVFAVENDRDGKPVRQLVAAQKTDSAGSIQLRGLFETCKYIVEYGKKDYRVLWSQDGAQSTCVVEVGKKKHTIRVIGDGKPAAGLNVTLGVSPGGGFTPRQTAVTNAAGECVFDDVPDDECYVCCEGQFAKITWSRKRDFEIRITVGKDEMGTVNFDPPHKNLIRSLRRISESVYEILFVGGRVVRVNGSMLALYGLEEYSKM